MTVVLHQGDCVTWAREYTGEPFHALLCDAPYEMAFMSKGWDASGVAFDPETWRALASVLYPGAFLFVFAGTINDDLISVAMREAGLRKYHKTAGWVTGSGFPKATRIDTQIDRKGGVSVGWFGEWLRKWRTENGIPQKEIAKLFPSKTGGLTGCVANWELGLNTPTNEQFNLICKTFGLPFNSLEEAEREVIGKGTTGGAVAWANGMNNIDDGGNRPTHQGQFDITAPATPLAQAWAGHRYGLQALKPAIETVLIFQKPYEGRPVDNITATGAGALNIDGARIGTDETLTREIDPDKGSFGSQFQREMGYRPNWHRKDEGKKLLGSTNGRWPANFYLDTEAARRLDEQSGERPSSGGAHFNHAGYGGATKAEVTNREIGYGDTGGASRYFFRVDEQIDAADPVRYVAKASRRERDAGLEGFELQERRTMGNGLTGVSGDRTGNGKKGDLPMGEAKIRNPHPTVKPLALTRYLATLLLPPAEYAPRRIFVPFAGVASEAIGAMQAGWEHVEGVELTEEYLPIARARVEYWQGQMESMPVNLPLFELDSK